MAVAFLYPPHGFWQSSWRNILSLISKFRIAFRVSVVDCILFYIDNQT